MILTYDLVVLSEEPVGLPLSWILYADLKYHFLNFIANDPEFGLGDDRLSYPHL